LSLIQNDRSGSDTFSKSALQSIIIHQNMTRLLMELPDRDAINTRPHVAGKLKTSQAALTSTV
jgi:hypothetical protein